MVIKLPKDFKEFLKSLNEHGIRYLVVGDYAVGFHGYPRATLDLDIWIEVSPDNAARLSEAVRDFGFDLPDVTPEAFLKDDAIICMGVEPMQIELMTKISGVEFSECYDKRSKILVDEVQIDVINLQHLIQNKRAADRHKDRDDLEHLE